MSQTPRERLAALLYAIDEPTPEIVAQALAHMMRYEEAGLGLTVDDFTDIWSALHRLECAYTRTIPNLGLEAFQYAERAGLVKRSADITAKGECRRCSDPDLLFLLDRNRGLCSHCRVVEDRRAA